MGARTAGVDGQTAAYIEWVRGEAAFLAELRADLPIFRDVFQPDDIFVSRALARALLAAKLRGFDFEDPARQGRTDP